MRQRNMKHPDVCLYLYPSSLKSVEVAWSPAPNSAGARMKMAKVVYDNSDLATTAKTGWDGFVLKRI